MHELSIAMSIADLALDEARKANALKIKEIEIEVGEWAGVDCDSLMFSLDAILKSEPSLKETVVNLHKLQPIMHCDGCGQNFKPDVQYIMQCPNCDSEQITLLQGRELSLKSLLIDD